MKKKVTLKQIIDSVVSDVATENYTVEEYDKYETERENNTRQLYRKFDKLLSLLGSDKEVLKGGRRNMDLTRKRFQ